MFSRACRLNQNSCSINSTLDEPMNYLHCDILQTQLSREAALPDNNSLHSLYEAHKSLTVVEADSWPAAINS